MIDFLGIGAQKAGTTWLFERLCEHPAISFPAGKEMHFWDGPGAAHGPEAWLERFPPAIGKQGEITPAYAILEPATIERIHACAPHLRLFYSLRNPMERAWSSALMALSRAEMRFDEASDAWFADHFRSAGSRRRGDYLTCLDNWQTVFPAGSLQVILFDDIVARPRDVLERLARHLGVEAEFFSAQPEHHLRQPVFAGPGHELRPSLAALLQELYGGQIQQLEHRTGLDLSRWRQTERPRG